jgi:GT2 family glycosyltransferase
MNQSSQTRGMSAVVIGRNEGARLQESLRSIQEVGLPLVYSDSASSDGSDRLAQSIGVLVVHLDPAAPLSAGRGRNEGLDEVLRQWPETAFVMFLDGDCILDASFPAKALEVFERDARCAIVTGHLTERFPERSIYNRLCSIEWRSPAGPMTNMNALGGIMAIRVAAFKEAGGFHLDAIAGEEPDLGARLMLLGYSITKIDAAMAVHDAEMLRFGQWWLRSVRSGHALAYRFSRHGRTELRDGQREILSDLFWGLALPAASIGFAWITNGWSLLLLGAYAVLFRRAFTNYRRRGVSKAEAWLVSRFIIYDKFAHVIGIAKFLLNKARGEYRIIEYK